MDQPGHHTRIRGNQPGAADRMRELLARTAQDYVADQRSTHLLTLAEALLRPAGRPASPRDGSHR